MSNYVGNPAEDGIRAARQDAAQEADFQAALRREIGCRAEAKAFLKALHDSGRGFHLEDDPADILRGGTDLPLFTAEEAELVSERVAQCYRQTWGDYGCPIGYLLELMNDEEI